MDTNCNQLSRLESRIVTIESTVRLWNFKASVALLLYYEYVTRNTSVGVKIRMPSTRRAPATSPSPPTTCFLHSSLPYPCRTLNADRVGFFRASTCMHIKEGLLLGRDSNSKLYASNERFRSMKNIGNQSVHSRWICPGIPVSLSTKTMRQWWPS